MTTFKICMKYMNILNKVYCVGPLVGSEALKRLHFSIAIDSC